MLHYCSHVGIVQGIEQLEGRYVLFMSEASELNKFFDSISTTYLTILHEI